MRQGLTQICERCLTFYHGNVHFEAEKKRGVFLNTRPCSTLCDDYCYYEESTAHSRVAACLFYHGLVFFQCFHLFEYMHMYTPRERDREKKKHVTQLHLQHDLMHRSRNLQMQSPDKCTLTFVAAAARSPLFR